MTFKTWDFLGYSRRTLKGTLMGIQEGVNGRLGGRIGGGLQRGLQTGHGRGLVVRSGTGMVMSYQWGGWCWVA